MTLYLFLALIFAGTLWLAVVLCRVGFRLLKAQNRAHKKRRAIVERLQVYRQRPGGTPDNPIKISSPVLVEAKAEEMPCPRCGTGMRLEAHRAIGYQNLRLRVAALKCPSCDHRHEVYFALQVYN